MSITIVDLPGIDAKGKGTVIWVPAIANIAAPTVAEITAGTTFNLSCTLYEWDVTVTQSQVDRTKYCYESATKIPGKPTYEIADLVYDYDPQNILSSDPYGHYAKLAAGSTGYFVDRRGLGKSVAPVANQIIDIYPAKLGIQARVKIDPNAEAEMLRIRQTVSVTADPKFDVKIVT